jgi:hypothetical protein
MNIFRKIIYKLLGVKFSVHWFLGNFYSKSNARERNKERESERDSCIKRYQLKGTQRISIALLSNQRLCIDRKRKWNEWIKILRKIFLTSVIFWIAFLFYVSFDVR